VNGDGTGLRRINTGWGHRYELDGRKVDGVTTLLKDGLPKPALVGWGIKSVAEYVADNLDSVYGMQPMGRNAIVQALKQAPYSQRDEAANRGTDVHALAEKLIHGEEVEVPDALRGHVDAYVKYLDEWKPEPVIVERPVGHRKGVGADGLEHPMADLGITDTRVIWVRSDGYDVIPIKADDDAFMTFKYVATVARAARGLKELVGAPIYQEAS
jgi:hypothetical protein